MPAMLTPYRLISPFLATALVALPVSQAQAAAFAQAGEPAGGGASADATVGGDTSPPAAPAEGAEGAPAEGAEGAPAEGAEGAPAEGAEGAPAEGAEGAPAEGAEGAPAEGAEGAPVEGAEGMSEEVAEPEPAPEPEVAPAPVVPEGPERPPEPMIAGKSAKGKGMMIAGGVLLAGGIAGTITSLLLTSCPEPANTVGCKYEPHRTLAVPLAVSGALAGGLLLAVGVGYGVRYKRWQRWKPEDERVIKQSALVPTMTPGGAGLGYVGRF